MLPRSVVQVCVDAYHKYERVISGGSSPLAARSWGFALPRLKADRTSMVTRIGPVIVWRPRQWEAALLRHAGASGPALPEAWALSLPSATMPGGQGPVSAPIPAADVAGAAVASVLSAHRPQLRWCCRGGENGVYSRADQRPVFRPAQLSVGLDVAAAGYQDQEATGGGGYRPEYLPSNRPGHRGVGWVPVPALAAGVRRDFDREGRDSYLNNLCWNQIDGRYASMAKDLALVVGAATLKDLGSTYRNASVDRSALDRLMELTAGVRVSAHVPAPATNRQDAVIRRGMSTTATAPVWEGVTIIPDEVTKAKAGQIVITAVMLFAMKVLRTGAGLVKQGTDHA